MSDERPSSFGQALETAGYDASGDSSSVPDTDTGSIDSTADGSSPSTDAAPALSSEAAPPAASPTETPLAAEPPPGPLPYERHKAILDKAYAERDTLKAQVEQLAWAQQVPAEKVHALAAMVQQANGNPVAFLREFAAQIQNDPRYAAELRSYAASTLAQRPAAAAPVDDEPRADIVVDGHSWYSEAQQAKREQWLARKLGSELNAHMQEQVGPLAALAKRVADAESQQQVTAQAKTWAANEFDKVSSRPGFKEHQAAISAAFDAEIAKVPLADQDRLAPVVLRDVYNDIVLPTLATDSNKHLLNTLTAKAVTGSLGTRPTVAATATRPKSWSDAFSQAGVS